MAINFMQMKNLYQYFKLAINKYQAVIVEWLYKELLPIYLRTGKYNDFDFCGMLEEFYGSIDYMSLHLTQINQTIPLYKFVDTYGFPMSKYTIDGFF